MQGLIQTAFITPHRERCSRPLTLRRHCGYKKGVWSRIDVQLAQSSTEIKSGRNQPSIRWCGSPGSPRSIHPDGIKLARILLRDFVERNKKGAGKAGEPPDQGHTPPHAKEGSKEVWVHMSKDTLQSHQGVFESKASDKGIHTSQKKIGLNMPIVLSHWGPPKGDKIR